MNEQGYAVGWGTLSLINAGLAQVKGRSGLGWWLVSLPIGPLATLLIVVLPVKRGPHVRAEKLSAPTTLPDKV
ncbi:MAG: hypothetical protein QM747_14545 [Nocardioides sp.]